ncbi:MAG: ammonium transporter [Phycisphaerae bacterium]
MGFTRFARASTARWMFGLAAVVLVMTMAGQLFAQTAPITASATAAVAAAAPAATAPAPVTGVWAQQNYDTGSTAWMLASTALVMIMMPGLALYYGGIVRKKNFLATMMTSYSALGVIIVQWFIFGYMLSFGTSTDPTLQKFIGWEPSRFMMLGVNPITAITGVAGAPSGGQFPVPETIFNMFQAMFAVITPALIAGSIAERMKYGAWCLFILLWGTLVYDPLAHFIWGGGWLQQLGAVDFAGGTVVHISSGVSGLVAAIMIGKRKGHPNVIQPNSLFNTLTGAGLLWFGWYGFNAGSANAANGLACAAFLNTTVATAMAGLAWNFAEWMHHRRATSLGMASGFVAGLVAITPACGYVALWSSPIIGLAAGIVCYWGAQIKTIFGYDDALDAFGVHGIGGFLGAVLTGVFASSAVGGVAGWIDGNFHQVLLQFLAAGDAAVYAGAMTAIIIFVMKLFMEIRVSEQVEIEGLDLGIHGEVGLDTNTFPEQSVAMPFGAS